MRAAIIIYTSGFGAGFSPFAPGTVGTAVAMLLYLAIAPLNRLDGHWWAYILVTAVVAVTGTWAATRAEEIYGEHDPGKVVIDEIAGYFVTMFLIPTTWYWILAGFFVFRFFDVLKPPPVNELQKLPRGAGVVVDDLAAGVYACLALHTLRFAVGYFF